MKPRTGPNDVKVRLTEKFWRRFGAPLNEKSAQLVVLQLVTLILAEREGDDTESPRSVTY